MAHSQLYQVPTGHEFASSAGNYSSHSSPDSILRQEAVPSTSRKSCAR